MVSLGPVRAGPCNILIKDHSQNLSATPMSCCAGDYVVLRAEMDLVAVMSACPASDISPLNGPTGKSHDVHCQVFAAP